MATDQNTEIEEGIVVEGAAGKIETFFEENQKVVFSVVIAIILAVAVYVGYERFVMAPKEVAAQEAVFYAQNWFAAGEFQKALEGDGANYGFYEIMDDYKSTKVGKAAKLYAGTCELNLGNYDEAITYLSKFSTKDANVQALAYSRLGDAYAQLENVADAAKEYKKAASASTLDEFKANYYYKAAMAFEYNDDLSGAASMYKEITTIYPNANDFSLTAAAQKLQKQVI